MMERRPNEIKRGVEQTELSGMKRGLKIYIASSWKNKAKVREIANQLRKDGHKVYDFTDPETRKVPEELPPDAVREFDPEKHKYSEFIRNRNFYASVMDNQEAIRKCDLVIMLLPCGNDSHADWAYGVGQGKASIVTGQPQKGGQSYTQLWADKIIDNPDDIYEYIKENY